jgi:hypothetical protein
MLKSRDGVRMMSSGSNLLSSFGPRVADVVAAAGATVTLNCSRRAPIRDSFRPTSFPSSKSDPAPAGKILQSATARERKNVLVRRSESRRAYCLVHRAESGGSKSPLLRA